MQDENPTIITWSVSIPVLTALMIYTMRNVRLANLLNKLAVAEMLVFIEALRLYNWYRYLLIFIVS